jgi:ubiquinone/menaquinone biosynthesis C-methylase UbiE
MTLANWTRQIRTFLPQEIPGPIATLYEKIAAPGLCQFYHQAASEIASSLSSGKVLDVGTGPGHLLVEIARCNPNLKLVGLDLSRKMLKIAEKSVAQDGKVCASLVRGDIQNLPFPDGMFDLVVSTLSIHHWRDPAKGIRECLRVTAPGGCCWIYDLRTDVSARTHGKLVTGKGLRRLFLGWVFKFHGVDPKQYQASTVASWLGGSATVQTEVDATYLRLNIQKPLYELQDKTTCFESASSLSSPVLPM